LYELVAVGDVRRAVDALRTLFDAHDAAGESFDPAEVVACVLDSVADGIAERDVLEALGKSL
jgi:phage-related baseplate assembly protein